MIVVPDEGKVFLLEQLLRTDPAEIGSVWLRLFQNNITIGPTTVRSDLVESNYAGYSLVELTRPGWTAAQVSGDSALTSWGGGILSFFSTSGTQACYGYFVTDADDNYILWGENRSSAFLINTSAPLYLVPTMRLKAFT